MPLGSLTEIDRAIRSSWSRETVDPVDYAAWSPANPSRGQCAVTAVVVNDLLGGEILMAEVRYTDGTRQGLHDWNRLAGGVELDLTREQFFENEVVGTPEAIPTPTDKSTARLARQYVPSWSGTTGLRWDSPDRTIARRAV